MRLTLPTTRAEAFASGADRYFTGLPCKHGHVAERYVSGSCVACREGYYRSRAPHIVAAARRHRRENREAIGERRRAHYAATKARRGPLRIAYFKLHWFAARAQNLRGTGHATARDLGAMWKRQRGRCALTGRRLDRTAEIDHIIPRALGGRDTPANLRWVVKSANRAKRDLLDEDFIALCRDVIAVADR
jgi:5-methylcytosine-specific restriction endonuclease McrA